MEGRSNAVVSFFWVSAISGLSKNYIHHFTSVSIPVTFPGWQFYPFLLFPTFLVVVNKSSFGS
jgi:hypothetical protein